MGTRENILSNPTARDRFLQGCRRLSLMDSGVSAAQAANFLANNVPGLTMQGINQQLSYYDLLVLWHSVSMSINVPPGNAAHSAPVFLPWHRMYMLTLERWIQIIEEDDDFGLPYWDWAADGELPTNSQWQTALWSSDYLGGPRNTVTDGEVGQMLSLIHI